MSALLIRRCRVIDPLRKSDSVRDVYVRDGKFSDAAPPATVSSIDGRNLWLMPGLIDLRSILRRESDVRSATRGGYTRLVLSFESTLTQHALIETSFVSRAVSKEQDTLSSCAKDALALSTGFDSIESAQTVRRAMQYANDRKLLLMLTCLDRSLALDGVVGEGEIALRFGLKGTPRSAEVSRVARDLVLARETSVKLHINHVTCRESIHFINASRAHGLKVTCDVTPHHVMNSSSAAFGYDRKARVLPVFQSEEDVDALRTALREGAIDAVASDHQTSTQEEREHPFSAADVHIDSLGNSFATLASLGLDVMKWVSLFTTGPAAIVGHSEWCRLDVGAPANFAIFDPKNNAMRLTVLNGITTYEARGE